MKALTKNGKLIIVDGALLAAPSIDLQEKTVQPSMEGQTVTADSGFEGLSSVVIEGDANLIPENIAKDVVIFGITGIHEGGEDLSEEIAAQDIIIDQIKAALEEVKKPAMK